VGQLLEPAPLDRRARRRQQTLEEVLDIAVELMTEHGVAGLSIGDVARRMGIQPPSLYVYFPSKTALYDALFARGAAEVLQTMERAQPTFEPDGRSLEELLGGLARIFVGWCLDHPAYSQLLFWRPVPGFTPSAEAYAPAVRLTEMARAWFTELQDAGLVRADAAAADLRRAWFALLAGVISQQLSNAPEQGRDGEWFTDAMPILIAMFAQHYAATAPTRGRTRHAKPR
jgi:AcrR family transcriptional regulator